MNIYNPEINENIILRFYRTSSVIFPPKYYMLRADACIMLCNDGGWSYYDEEASYMLCESCGRDSSCEVV